MTEELSSWFLRGYRLDWIGFERVHLISTPAENESINLLIPSHSENDSKSTMTVHSALLAFDLMFMMTEELFSWFLSSWVCKKYWWKVDLEMSEILFRQE